MEVLLVLQIIVVIALIGVILVQKTGSDGFTGGSSPNSFLTGRASANLFTRTTAVLATIFLVNSLVLAYMASHSQGGSSIIEQATQEVEQDKKAGGEKPVDNLGDIQKKLQDISKAPKTEPAKATDKPVEAPKPAAPSVPKAE